MTAEREKIGTARRTMIFWNCVGMDGTGRAASCDDLEDEEEAGLRVRRRRNAIGRGVSGRTISNNRDAERRRQLAVLICLSLSLSCTAEDRWQRGLAI